MTACIGDTIVADGRRVGGGGVRGVEGVIFKLCKKIQAANLLLPTTTEDEGELRHLKL